MLVGGRRVAQRHGRESAWPICPLCLPRIHQKCVFAAILIPPPFPCPPSAGQPSSTQPPAVVQGQIRQRGGRPKGASIWRLILCLSAPAPPLPLAPLSFPLTCSLSPTLSPSSASSSTSQCHGSLTLQVGSKERTRAISSWIWARLAQEAPRIPACARRSKHLMCFSSYLRPWLHAEKASSYLLGK